MPSLELAVQGLARFEGLPARATLARWVVSALEVDAELTLRFVGAAEARRLNRTYRGRDYATNVLTFDYRHAPVVKADIVLCVPLIRREARARGKSTRDHLAHLLVHGVLHAQGHQHENARQARRMEAREIAILARAGVADPYRSGGTSRSKRGPRSPQA
jgi:probable rRNA maturation factor